MCLANCSTQRYKGMIVLHWSSAEISCGSTVVDSCCEIDWLVCIYSHVDWSLSTLSCLCLARGIHIFLAAACLSPTHRTQSDPSECLSSGLWSVRRQVGRRSGAHWRSSGDSIISRFMHLLSCCRIMIQLSSHSIHRVLDVGKDIQSLVFCGNCHQREVSRGSSVFYCLSMTVSCP